MKRLTLAMTLVACSLVLVCVSMWATSSPWIGLANGATLAVLVRVISVEIVAYRHRDDQPGPPHVFDRAPRTSQIGMTQHICDECAATIPIPLLRREHVHAQIVPDWTDLAAHIWTHERPNS